jgi:hypothetical protein
MCNTKSTPRAWRLHIPCFDALTHVQQHAVVEGLCQLLTSLQGPLLLVLLLLLTCPHLASLLRLLLLWWWWLRLLLMLLLLLLVLLLLTRWLLLLLLCVHQHEQCLLEVQESLRVSMQSQRGKLLPCTRCSCQQVQQ